MRLRITVIVAFAGLTLALSQAALRHSSRMKTSSNPLYPSKLAGTLHLPLQHHQTIPKDSEYRRFRIQQHPRKGSETTLRIQSFTSKGLRAIYPRNNEYPHHRRSQ